jgi:hypothetical protein
MPKDLVQEQNITIRFGGGLNTASAPDDISDIEAVAGFNYQTDVDNRQLRPRPALDKIGTVPNGLPIRGLATLRNSKNEVTFLVQAGGTVYRWDGDNFTQVGSVNPNARLRGKKEHYWELDDKVFITDLALQQPVMEWDGVEFKQMPTNLTGDFLAKYCRIETERAVFANLISNSTPTPSLIVASRAEDNTVLSLSNVPSSSLGANDPFFVQAPDLRAVNALDEAFNVGIVSTEGGRIYRTVGSSAQDYQIIPFYENSGARGDEALVFTGSDIVYGRQGRIESLTASDRFGDLTVADLSRSIRPSINTIRAWTAVWNRRTSKGYFFPQNENAVWQYDPALALLEVSPWVRWTTKEPVGYQPTVAMAAFDPRDRLEYIFLGDSNGNLYRLEGSGKLDAGVSTINVRWRTKLINLPLNMESFDLRGYLKYLKADAPYTVNMAVRWTGETAYNQNLSFTVPAVQGGSFWGDPDTYWNGDFYYNAPFQDRILRRAFSAAGKNSDVQIEINIDSAARFILNETGFRFDTATKTAT